MRYLFLFLILAGVDISVRRSGAGGSARALRRVSWQIGQGSGGPLGQGTGSSPMRDYDSTWRRGWGRGEVWKIVEVATWACAMGQGLRRVGLSWLSSALCCRVVFTYSHWQLSAQSGKILNAIGVYYLSCDVSDTESYDNTKM